MKVKSFGCSFTYGTDLSDDNRRFDYPKPSQLTWPALLAQQHSMPYECYARPGGGNLYILNQVLAQTAMVDPAIFIINWTWIDRFDFNDPLNDEWDVFCPIDTRAQAEYYYRNLHSQYRDKLVSLSYIKLALDTLKQRNIPFIMTYIDSLILETKWHATPAITTMQDAVMHDLSTFDGKSFLEWSREKGYPISSTLHPLEAAHAAAAELMLITFRKQNTIDR